MATLEQLPPDSGGKPGGGEHSRGGAQPVGQGGGAASYAGRVAGKQGNGRKKLNVLDIMLERRSNQVSYNMSKEELSRLLFKKMKIDPKNVLKIDTSGFGKVHIELADNINPESFADLPAFDIHEGLRVKYYKPHHRKETLVTVSWLDLETPDELLVHVFDHFGKVKSNVRWSRIRQDEGDSALAKLLDNIMNGERQFWMEITKPLPSYAVIDNRKIKIHHAGQRRTCARCQKVADQCQGNSNARLCEDNGGVKVNAIDAWKDTLALVNYTEWVSGEFAAVEEVLENDDQDNSDEEKAPDISNCDGFVISNLDEATTIDDIRVILKGVAPDDAISGMTVHPTGSTRSKMIKDIDPALVTTIAKKVDSKSFKGRLLHCRPHVPVTPPKKEAENETNKEDSVKAEDIPKEPSTSPSKGKDPEILKSEIPGLSQKEIDKAKKKKADKMKKEEKKKEEKKKGKPKDEGKKTKDLKTNDFLLNSTTKDDNFDEFEFPSGSDSEEEFEDSVEALASDNIEKLMTPKPFKSLFATQVEASGSKRQSSLAGLSPIDKAEVKKAKSVRKSSLPRMC